MAFEGLRLIALAADVSQSFFPLVLVNRRVVLKVEVLDRRKRMI